MASHSANPGAPSGHQGGHHGEHHDDGAVHAHIAHPLFYWAVFGALIVLTFITVGVSYFDFGSANTVIAMLVATMKATLVATFFMHLLHDKLFNTICLVASFVFLGVFFFFTYEDTSSRNRIDEVNGSHVLVTNAQTAPGGFANTPIPVTGGEHGEGHSGGEHH
jgi:cytochrome c oxidase subunit 4